jgi:anti-anti-sigma regulatory factor
MTLIECQPELDIASVGALHQQILDALPAGVPLEVDGRAVRKVHAAALQLFLSAIAEARLLGVQWRWREPSPSLVEGARLLGLTDHLMLGDDCRE